MVGDAVMRLRPPVDADAVASVASRGANGAAYLDSGKMSSVVSRVRRSCPLATSCGTRRPQQPSALRRIVDPRQQRQQQQLPWRR